MHLGNGNIKKDKLLYCVFIFLGILTMMESVVYSSYVGAGVQYDFSMLNYSFNNSGEPASYTLFTDIGMYQNNKTYSHDYGFSLFYDDAEEFDYLYGTQLKFEYYKFYIPFEKTNNAIKGTRMGVIILLCYDIINYNYNQAFLGFNTGFYFSNGKDEKKGYDYITLESPLGIVIGNKYDISNQIALIGTYTFNFYTNLTANNLLAEIFNSIEGSSESFKTGRKEMIFTISCAYQL
jgi:hypothetical protein